MRLIDADAFKDYCRTGLDETKAMIRSGSMRAFAEKLTESFVKDIDEQPTVPQWIPVAERLPDKEGRYLVSNGQIGDWVTDIDFWIHQNNRMQWKYGKKVLAWMPLPDPYQQKGGAE